MKTINFFLAERYFQLRDMQFSHWKQGWKPAPFPARRAYLTARNEVIAKGLY